MTIALSQTDADASVWTKAAVLAVIAVVITFAVYGAVALIVKADDMGLHLAQEGRTGFGRRVGAAVVKGMPGFMKVLTVVGTAAMLWVGGNIVVHAVHEIGWHLPYDLIHGAAQGVGQGNGFVEWAVTALLDGIVGIALGYALLPVVEKAMGAFGKGAEAH
jgi:predicted DNA repair protein MutK